MTAHPADDVTGVSTMTFPRFDVEVRTQPFHAEARVITPDEQLIHLTVEMNAAHTVWEIRARTHGNLLRAAYDLEPADLAGEEKVTVTQDLTYSRCTIRFRLPGGQRVDLMVDMHSTETTLAKWRVSSFLLDEWAIPKLQLAEYHMPIADPAKVKHLTTRLF